MDKDLETKEIENKIQEFCNRKNLKNPFVQECISEFVKGHTELYGDIVPVDDLLNRLEENLDKITFAGQGKTFDGELGEYKGRIADNTDVNEIFIYFDESQLDLSEEDRKMWNLYSESDRQKLLQEISTKRAYIKSTLIHELTHAAYTIKDEYGIGEKHIFSETGKDYSSKEYRQIGGHSNDIEAIVNYISSRVQGKTPDEVTTYKAETKAIYMLAQKVDEKSIIQAAWNSNEEQLKQAYIEALGKGNEIGEQSYNAFQDKMSKLVNIRNSSLSLAESNMRNEKILSELGQIFDGNTIKPKFIKFEDVKHSPLDEVSTFTHNKETPLSFSQKIAKFFEKHQSLMSVPFIRNFVDKQLNVLPPAKQTTPNSQREEFVNELSSNGEYGKTISINNIEKGSNVVNINNPDIEK